MLKKAHKNIQNFKKRTNCLTLFQNLIEIKIQLFELSEDFSFKLFRTFAYSYRIKGLLVIKIRRFQMALNLFKVIFGIYDELPVGKNCIFDVLRGIYELSQFSKGSFRNLNRIVF